MTKKITLDEVERIYTSINEIWDSIIKEIHLSAKSLYNLIGLKKSLEQQHLQIQETVQSVMINSGAEVDGQGFLRTPDDKREEVAEKLMSLSKETIDFEVEMIIIKENDIIPASLMEIIFDFINFE